MSKLIDPVCGMGQPDAAGEMIVDVVADLLREPLVQARRVPLQLEDAPGGREVGAIAGRVPGRACRRSSRSSSTTSVQPSRVRWYSALQPTAPPPMTTTR